MDIPRVYIAGPDVFFPEPAAHFRRVIALLQAHGLEGVPPCDGGLSAGEAVSPSLARRIAEGNRALIRGCAAVLANLNPWRGPEPDAGTAWEHGFATGLGKLCVGYVDSAEDYLTQVRRRFPACRMDGPTWRDPEGCLIEDFGLPANLMLVWSGEFVSGGVNPAVALLAQRLKG